MPKRDLDFEGREGGLGGKDTSANEPEASDKGRARHPSKGSLRDNDYSVRPSSGKVASKYASHQVERIEPNSSSKESVSEQERRESTNDYFRRTQRKRGRLKAGLVAVVVVVALALAALAAGVVFMSSSNSKLHDGLEEGLSLKLEERAAQLEEEPSSVSYSLLVGLDTDRSGAYVANVIVVLRADEEEGTVMLMGMPYNLRAYIEGEGYSSLGNARASGGQFLLEETVSEILGIEFDHYFEADVAQFMEIVDVLGGIELDVPANTQFGGVSVEEGEQLLDSAQSTVLCRCWQTYASGDDQRMSNCLQVLAAVFGKASLSGAFDYVPLVNSLSASLVTDSDLSVLSFGKNMYAQASVYTGIFPHTQGTIDGVAYAFFEESDWAELYSRIEQSGPGVIEEQESPSSSSFDPSAYEVSVLNGAGISGTASQAQERLEEAGFPVLGVGNANQFVYDETLVVYDDEADLTAAENVIAALRCGRAVHNPGSYEFDGDILVVVGKDWVP